MPGGEIDHVLAKELALFIENDSQLNRSQYQPIVLNLARKKAKGIYDPKLAVKLVVYLVESGRKKYFKEVADLGPINKATKEAAAKDLLAGMQDEINMALKKIRSKKKKSAPKKGKKRRKPRKAKPGSLKGTLKWINETLNRAAVRFD